VCPLRSRSGWFRLERGVNALFIEQECDWAVVSLAEISARLDGETVGDYMRGAVEPPGSGRWSNRPAPSALYAELAAVRLRHGGGVLSDEHAARAGSDLLVAHAMPDEQTEWHVGLTLALALVIMALLLGAFVRRHTLRAEAAAVHEHLYQQYDGHPMLDGHGLR